MALSKNPYWIKSGAYSLLQNITRLLLGFGSFYILVRVLSVHDFGIWSLFLIISNFIEVARNGLVQNGLIVALNKGKATEKPEIQTSSFLINCFYTLCCVLLMLSCNQLLSNIWDSPELSPILLIFTSTILATLPFSQFVYLQQANFSFTGIFYANLGRNAVFFLFVLYHYFADDFPLTLNLLIIYQTISVLFGSLIGFFFGRRFLTKHFKFSKTKIFEMFRYGKYVLANNTASMFLRNIDQMLLGYLISPSAVASYNTALRITNLTEVPTQSVSSIVFPQSAKKNEEGNPDLIKKLYEKSVGSILALILPIVIFTILFPEFIVTVVAGDKYENTAAILQLMIFYSIFMPYSRQFGTILDSIGMPDKNLYFTVFGAILNTLLNYVCIIKFGVIGAVIGTLTAQAIRFIVQYIMLYKILQVNLFNTLKYAVHFYRFGWQTIFNKLSE